MASVMNCNLPDGLHCHVDNNVWVRKEADGTVELAARLGRPVKVTPACCSIALGDEVLALDAGRDALTVDIAEFLRASGRRSVARGLVGIPVVAA